MSQEVVEKSTPTPTETPAVAAADAAAVAAAPTLAAAAESKAVADAAPPTPAPPTPAPPTPAAPTTPTETPAVGAITRSRYQHGFNDGNAEQGNLNKAAQAKIDEEKNKILAQIKQLQLALTEKGQELDKAYFAAKGDDKTQEKVEAEMGAFSSETNERIDNLYKKLKKDDEPAIIKLFSGAWNLIKLKLKVIFDNMKKAPEVTEAQLNMLQIISKNIEDIQANGGSLDTTYAQNLENLILSISKNVSQTPGKDESSSKTPATPGTGMVDKIEGALNKLKNPEAAVVVPETKLDSAVVVPAAAAETAVAAGGGISRKPSHPKYINQISENRNKIFKKELEIINSIRRFHRSHTIRKRDKINSILGFKKSRNNRNRNHGNTKHTRRHMHRHQNRNNKYKSTKHIKK
jgi:hypothetical protein